MSRRNVISVCIVIAVIIVLIIILASTGIKSGRNNDWNSGSGGMYYATGQNESKESELEISDKYYKEAGQDVVNNNELEKTAQQKYIIKDIGDGIAIYKCFSDADKEILEFFDYALINIENLPQDKKELLKTGIELYGENELYEFLQAYSS